MNIKDTRTQLALALLLRIFATSKSIVAVVPPAQYSSYQPQSYYSQSLSGYGNENQNYYDNPVDQNPDDGYSNESYQRQQYSQTSYGASGGGFDDVDEQHSSYHQQDSFQPQTRYQDYLSGNFSPFRQEHNSSARQATSSLVSFDNIDFNNSETMNYQAGEDIVYPPLDSGIPQHHQHHQQIPRQQYLQPADYMKANNYISPMTPSRANSLTYISGDRAPKDNAGAQITGTISRPPTLPKTTQLHLHHQTNAKPYIENENPHQHHQDQQHIPRTSQHQPYPPPHVEPQFTDNSALPANSSPSRTYYVADSDLSANSISQASDAQPVSLLQSHLVQLPVVSSQPPPAQVAPSSFGIPSEPFPISKHVEITKHVPVPIYRQIHVPFRKPVRIEIPRPVISTISRPYPIQMQTITKTVAVPRVKEVKIPIEKLMPYPVEHRVPYVVEKRVPFQIEKQVATPIYYPFPVKVPMVRTIVHKKRVHAPPLHYRPRVHM